MQLPPIKGELAQVIKSGNPKNLNCVQVNLRSGISTNEEDYFFREIEALCQPVMFSETWLASEHDVYSIPAYRTYYINHLDIRGGGVSILRSGCIDYKLLPEIFCSNNWYQALGVKWWYNIVRVCYPVPGEGCHDFFAFLHRTLEFVNINKYQLILSRDFKNQMVVTAV